MFQFLRKYFMPDETKRDAAYFLVNRHYLESISPEDMDGPMDSMGEQEKREYFAEASQVFTNKAFRRELKWLLAQQALFVASQSPTWEGSLIGRGTINGIGLIEDRFRVLHSMHLDATKPQEAVEPGVIPSVTE